VRAYTGAKYDAGGIVEQKSDLRNAAALYIPSKQISEVERKGKVDGELPG